jgi:PAS domain S-box-containing protein
MTEFPRGNPDIPDSTTIYQELNRIQVHDNVCLLYQSPQEWQACISAFIKIGLEKGEKCCYVYDTHHARDVRAALKTEGVDTAAAESSGKLMILHGHNVYMQDGSFNPDRVIDFLKTETNKAIAEGYTALRITGERDWVLHKLPGSEKLLEYEEKLNRDFLPNYPCLGICQYDSRQMDADFIRNLVFYHPVLLRNYRVYSNYYYVPARTHLDIQDSERIIKIIYSNIEREDRIERDLQNTNQKLQMLFEDSSTVVLVMDQKGRCVDANNTALKFLECSSEELLQKTFHDFYSIEYLEEKHLESIPFLPAKNMETEYRVNDKIKVLNFNMMPVNSGNKPLIYIIGQDITERKEMERNLHEIEEHYSEVFENTADAIFIIDIDDNGNFKYVNYNPVAQRAIRKPLTNLSKVRVEDCFSPDVAAELIANYKRCASIREVIKYDETIKIDNFEYCFNTTLIPLLDNKGQVRRIIDVSHDITERKKFECELKESEARYKSLVNNIKLGIFRTTPDYKGKFLEINQAMETITGYSRDELLATNVIDIYLKPEERKAILDQIVASPRKPTHEFTLKRKDQAQRIVSVTLFAIKHESGETAFFDGILEDITERTNNDRT